MANIIINVGEFICEPPTLGNVYRNTSTTGDYVFNWSSLGDVYVGYGLNVTIKLYFIPEETPPEQEFTSISIPFNANNFSIGVLPYDKADFRLEFSIDNGVTCYHSINIPYSSIIIT